MPVTAHIEMTAADNTSNCSSPTVKDEKIVFALFSTFAGIAIFFYVASILVIVKTRTYRSFVHRLTLYLAFSGILLSLTNILQILPVDLNQNSIKVKVGLENLCAFAGFLRQYTVFLQALTVVWICFYIFQLVVRESQLKQLKYELIGVVTVVLVPFLFTWEPFITNSYGLRETRCWIIDDNCFDPYDIAFVYQLVINMIPRLLLTILSLILICIALITVKKKMIGRNLQRHHWLAIKEILPLTIFPSVFLAIILGRMVAVFSGKFSYDVADVFMVLEQTTSFAVPLSLLVRANVRQRLCRCRRSEAEEREPFTTTTRTTKGDWEN